MMTDSRMVGYGEFPVAPEYLTALIDVASALGMEPYACLQDSGLTPQIYLIANRRIGNVSLRTVTANLLANIPLETLICKFMDRLGVFNHGALAVAVQSCTDLREALYTVALFADTRSSGKVMTFSESTTHYTLEIVSSYDTDNDESQIDKFIVVSTLMVIASSFSHLLRGEHPLGELIFRFSLDDPEKLRNKLGVCNMFFSGGLNALRFFKESRFLPTIEDRLVFRDAIRECESQRMTFGSKNEIEIRVRLELSRISSFDLNLATIAAGLCMCPRSLQRRLVLAGTSFRELKADELHRRAVYFLEHTGMSVENIARELGYSHSSNFIKSFKARTNQSPTQYRDSFSSHHSLHS